MQPKRHDLLPSLCFLALLSLLVLIFFALARQSVEVRVYDIHTGVPLPHAQVENLTTARRQRTAAGWLFLGVDRRLSVTVSSPGYLPSTASWSASSPWSLWGQIDVHLVPTRLTGIVRDAETELSLAGAEVWIDTQPLMTDASGAFQRFTLAGGEPVKVNLDGYVPWQGVVLWDRYLLRGERLVVALRPNTVEGYVRCQESGELLSGATVEAAGQETITDQAGRFHLRRLRRGDTVTVKREGFWPAEVTCSGQSMNVALQPRLVEGVVRWQETGERLSGVTVKAAGQESITDRMGRFHLRGLRQGDTITAQREGFWPDSVVYTDELADLEVVLQDRRARVVVRSALEGVELANLEVTRNGQSLVSTPSGSFELKAWLSGELLEATAEGHWPTQICLGAPNDQNVRGVKTVEILLQPRVLTVTVRDGYVGWPLQGALVSSSPPKPTNDQGQVSLAPAMPGMVIDIRHPGYVGQTLQYDGQGSELEVRLFPHTIQGIVVDAETGTPIPGAALRQNGQVLFHTDSDGSFRLQGVKDPPVFTVRAPGYRLTQVAMGHRTSSVTFRPCPKDAASGGLCSEIHIAPFEARGVYIPFGLLSSRERTLAILDMISSTELNAVVLDVKGDRGWLAYSSDIPLAKELGVSAKDIMDIDKFLAICRRRNIYSIARLVVFKDNPLAHGKTDLAVKQADGSIWLDREKLGWANPYRQEVWDYNIGIAKEVAQLGFDEVQLDYLRFPSDGDLTQIVYEEKDSPEAKMTAIRTFVTQMREALEPYDVFLSADVFGLTLVVDPQSGLGIGQRVIDIAPQVDYLCPMVYPSTFISGNMGIADPALYPYEVVSKSLRQGMGLTSTRIRPWLQAYSLHGVTYGLERQHAQRRAAEMVGADGWTFWNAGGLYDARLFRRRIGNDARHPDGGRRRVE